MKNSRIIYNKILAYIGKIETYVGNDSFDDFVSDEQRVFACAFALCQISELITKLSEAEKARNAAIPWAAIKAMRNHIIHNYDNIDLDILYDAIKNDLPKLAKDIRNIE